ncbi:unnamed protein product, partial [Dicrocoelium dendriticum]
MLRNDASGVRTGVPKSLRCKVYWMSKVKFPVSVMLQAIGIVAMSFESTLILHLYETKSISEKLIGDDFSKPKCLISGVIQVCVFGSNLFLILICYMHQ